MGVLVLVKMISNAVRPMVKECPLGFTADCLVGFLPRSVVSENLC